MKTLAKRIADNSMPRSHRSESEQWRASFNASEISSVQLNRICDQIQSGVVTNSSLQRFIYIYRASYESAVVLGKELKECRVVEDTLLPQCVPTLRGW